MSPATDSPAGFGARAAAAALPIAEKAALTSGASFYVTKSAAGREPVTFSDGPNGVRAQPAGSGQDHLGLSASLPATCFPPAAGLAQSWDEELIAEVGAALGRESRHFGVDVLLAPAVNIRRDPRCGRNFEYFSEDPHLAGHLGAAYVEGIQREGVGASVKHYAANNQETDRTRCSSEVDPRALREIYLKVFETIVTRAKPWTVMCSYNKINGEQVAESRWLLTDVLRGEWGFDGTVISDWGAVWNAPASVAAGLDLDMPGPRARGDAEVAEAIARGDLEIAALDAAVTNVLTLADRVAAGRAIAGAFDAEASAELAREAAARSVVLLKNDGDLLPLRPEQRVAVVGRLAVEPRFQGAGSGFVNARRVDAPLEFIQRASAPGNVTYAEGWGADGEDRSLRDAAIAAARDADVAVVFLGIDISEETEGSDRETIDLPRAQIDLLAAVAQAQPNTVAVLSKGGVVVLDEVVAHASAILDGALLGQGVGAAIADVLYGRVNPSGRLTETVPVRLADTPSYLNFPGENSRVEYGESIFVGYRHYDARDIDVTFPFGHGLSYTEFAYDDFHVEVTESGLELSVTITNTGARDGREVVQAYVGTLGSRVRRAPRELKAFRSVPIAAGESAVVRLSVPRNDLAYWDVRVDGWIVESGDYEVSIGASSRDLRAGAVVQIEGDEHRIPLTIASTIGEINAHPIGRTVIMPALMEGQAADDAARASAVLGSDVMRLVHWMPLCRMQNVGGAPADPAALQRLIDAANDAIRAG